MAPLITPVTVATPEITTKEDAILTTLPEIGSSDFPKSEYWIKSFTLIEPGNNGLALLTVLTPPLCLVIDATPTTSDGVWITLALKVFIPTTFDPSVEAPIPVFE